MIDLHSAQLRSAWTEADVAYVLGNSRFLAYLDSVALSDEEESALGENWRRMLWDDWVAIIWRRKLADDDFVYIAAHPRDRDLSIEAYRSLERHLWERMRDGEIARDPVWRQDYPEIYRPDPANAPWVNWNKRIRRGDNK